MKKIILILILLLATALVVGCSTTIQISDDELLIVFVSEKGNPPNNAGEYGTGYINYHEYDSEYSYYVSANTLVVIDSESDEKTRYDLKRCDYKFIEVLNYDFASMGYYGTYHSYKRGKPDVAAIEDTTYKQNKEFYIYENENTIVYEHFKVGGDINTIKVIESDKYIYVIFERIILGSVVLNEYPKTPSHEGKYFSYESIRIYEWLPNESDFIDVVPYPMFDFSYQRNFLDFYLFLYDIKSTEALDIYVSILVADGFTYIPAIAVIGGDDLTVLCSKHTTDENVSIYITPIENNILKLDVWMNYHDE